MERVFSIALTAVNNARETEEGDANLKDGLLQFVNEVRNKVVNQLINQI